MFGDKECDLRHKTVYICGCGNIVDIEDKGMNEGISKD